MPTMSSRAPQVLSSDSLVGTPVQNPEGEDLGHIEEIMVDLDHGRVGYAVLSFGGFLGFGDKLFAIPWQALTFDTDQEIAILNVDKALLKQAPGFDEDDWPDMSADNWGADVYGYYGYKPYW